MNNSGFKNLQKGIPEDYQQICLSEVVPQNEMQKVLIGKMDRLLRKECKTLLISGAVGTGKTYLSRAWLNEALMRLYKADKEGSTPTRYITHYELDLKFRSAMNDRTMSQAALLALFGSEYKYLVIDEFCRGTTTDYSMAFIENLIGMRYDWNLPTIIITNKTVGELKKLVDAQMLDRLGAKGQETFALDGESLR